ncbi:F-box SKIP23-like protein [Medicago truncatula]|uniref:F-box SKIP23-like protein n=2 Tax=Medicago truncatula TaxID=3880 RepID=A0A072UW30_MEDTR|nr:F-box SKIP23-like protein [Medicago truncatula]
MNQQHPSATPLMAPDWSKLPKDLLQLISEKLDSELYQLRFRSVCSSWHSSIPKKPLLDLPSNFPFPSNNTSNTNTFPLSKRSILLITPPNQTLHPPWLIKIGPDSRDKTRLWYPLSLDYQLYLQLPQLIDFKEYHIIHLGDEFVIGNFPSDYFSVDFMKKVLVYRTLHSYALLTINVSGKLAIFRSGDEHWTIIMPEELSSPYSDVCLFKGRPIAVDFSGRTVAVGPDLGLDLVAESVGVFGGDKKLLVDSNGELLLVHKYVNSVENCFFNVFAFYEIGDVRFQVFNLDEKEKKWVEVRNLGDRVLFWGEDGVFSASASELGVGNGNCVIFRDDPCPYSNNRLADSVYCLQTDKISPLSDFPGYSKLFWPLPEWVGLH